MIERTEDQVNIRIDEQELIEAMALLTDLRDYTDQQHGLRGISETSKALTVALETMTAFFFEHFSEEDDD